MVGIQPPPLPSITSHNASGPHPVPAPRETPPSPFPERLSFPLPHRALRGAEERRGGRKRRAAGIAGKCGPKVASSHILPERERPDRQPGLRLPATFSVCFCSKKKKKKNPTVPLLTLHTHSHTPTADTHIPWRRRESRVSPSCPAASLVLAPQQSGKAEARAVTSDPMVMRCRRIP